MDGFIYKLQLHLMVQITYVAPTCTTEMCPCSTAKVRAAHCRLSGYTEGCFGEHSGTWQHRTNQCHTPAKHHDNTTDDTVKHFNAVNLFLCWMCLMIRTATSRLAPASINIWTRASSPAAQAYIRGVIPWVTEKNVREGEKHIHDVVFSMISRCDVPKIMLQVSSQHIISRQRHPIPGHPYCWPRLAPADRWLDQWDLCVHSSACENPNLVGTCLWQL